MRWDSLGLIVADAPSRHSSGRAQDKRQKSVRPSRRNFGAAFYVWRRVEMIA